MTDDEKQAQRNSTWITQVRRLLRAGFGVDDIAVDLKCRADDGRAEVAILRKDGVLNEWYQHIKSNTGESP